MHASNVSYMTRVLPSPDVLAQRFKDQLVVLEERDANEMNQRIVRIMEMIFEQITGVSSKEENLTDLYLWKIMNPNMEIVYTYESLGLSIVISPYRDLSRIRLWVGYHLTSKGRHIDIAFRRSATLHKGNRTIH